MKTFILKTIYTPFVNKLLRNISYPFSKLIGKPLISISGKLTVKYRDIRFQLFTNQTCSVTQELFYKGAEQYEFSRLFEQLIKRSKVFFDIGANIGYFSILSAKLNKDVTILAFEPSNGPLHYLRNNVKLNKLENRITIVDKAVSHIDGQLTFYDVINPKYYWLEYNLNGSNSLQNTHGKDKTSSYPVNVTTLDTIIINNNIERVDLIKLDTECTEHLILESSIDMINSHRPLIICEVYNVIYKEVEAVLKQLKDYETYQVLSNRLEEIDRFGEAVKDEHNYIFCPIERKAEILELNF